MAKLVLYMALAAISVLATCQATSVPCTDDPTGIAYRGQLSETLSGRTCQPWTSQSPHEHSRIPANYPDAGLDQNYCRNPDNGFTAWCYTTDTAQRWEYCAVGEFIHQCTDPECYTVASGSDYRGNVATSRSGLTCQSWTSQEPQSHSRTPERYPNAGLGDHNLCRNPDGSNFAWCYTTDPSVRWEYCNIGVRQESC